MNRRLGLGALAGFAAAAIGVCALSYSAPSVSVDVPANRVGAGVLRLDLSGGGASTTLDIGDLLPGAASTRLFWLATNDDRSPSPASLGVTFSELVDRPAACSITRSKALGEVASGIAGCSVAGDVVTGTPAQGNLSRLVVVRIRWAPATSGCSSPHLSWTEVAGTGRDNLRRAAAAGRHLLATPDGPLRLPPGAGVCLAVSAHWPPGSRSSATASPEHPTDNAAQGDSLSVRVRFDLTQVS